MADFVDYTNVTEFEKFTFKLSSVMKEMINSGTECESKLLVLMFYLLIFHIYCKKESFLEMLILG